MVATCCKIEDLQQRIGRRLEIDQLDRWREGGLQRAFVGEVDILHRDAAVGEDAREQPVGAAIEIVAGQDLLARFQQPRTAVMAARPVEKQKARVPDSSSASWVSSTARVGLPLRV